MDQNDDTYTIEDSGGSIEELEREMHQTAKEAAGGATGGAAGSQPAEESGETGAPEGGGAPLTDEGLRAENEQLKNRYLRTLADFENFRKRNEREKADFFKHALGKILGDILPVLDNFDRALEHAEEGDEFHKGVLLIYKQLFDVLQRNGLTPVDEVGVHFDPNIHEAVIREEDPSVPSHTVVAVLQRGYFLHDRLLRPALVKVAVGGPERATVAS